MKRGFSLLEVLISIFLVSFLFWLFARLAVDANVQQRMSEAHFNESQLLSSVSRTYASDVRSALTYTVSPPELEVRKIDLSADRGLDDGVPSPPPASWSPYDHLETLQWRLADEELRRVSSIEGERTLLTDVVRVQFSQNGGTVTMEIDLGQPKKVQRYTLREVLYCTP